MFRWLPGLNEAASATRNAAAGPTGGGLSTRVPVRWIKFLIGVFLLPICWITSAAFFTSFTATTIQHAFWLTEEFWFFGVGVIIWLCWFFGLPKPVMIYVFGHEITHAIWVWMMGGRVTRIEFGRDGGQIFTSKTNLWIALAPYFFPVYSAFILAIYALVSAFGDPAPIRRWFFGLLGATWCFHLTFTCWMLGKKQTDLAEHGTFFSVVVIYLLNLAVLSLLFVAASGQVTWMSFLDSWVHEAGNVSDFVLRTIKTAGDTILAPMLD